MYILFKDFDIDSCDEKLTIVDVIQISSPSTDNEQKLAFKPFSTHVKTYQNQHQSSHSHQHVHNEQQQQQQENESDLRQQIENVSNKSDLQLQTQQQHFVQREEVGGTTTTTSTSFITKNGNNMPNEQEEKDESQNQLLYQTQYENNNKVKEQIANTCNPYGNSKKIEDGRINSSAFERVYDDEKATSNSSNKYSNGKLLLHMNIFSIFFFFFFV